MLLLSGRLLSAIGSQVTAIAYPLLVLAVTHSPAKAGLVGFAGLLPHAVFGLPAGVAVDRWNRKRIMVAADGVRAVAIATLATLILLDEVSSGTSRSSRSSRAPAPSSSRPPTPARSARSFRRLSSPRPSA